VFCYDFARIPGDGRLERYAVSRLKILIVEALCLSAAALGAADEFGYSPDGGLVSFGELTSRARLRHHARMAHSATSYGRDYFPDLNLI